MLEQKLFFLVATAAVCVITILLVPILVRLDLIMKRTDAVSRGISEDIERTRTFLRTFEIKAIIAAIKSIPSLFAQRRERRERPSSKKNTNKEH